MVNNPLNFFIPQVIEKINSPINGEIQIIKQLGGLRIVVNHMLQSGGLVEFIWRKGINKISHYPLSIIHVLILGLGGGSAAKIINQLFPQAKITGIEIDPVMIKLGKKYFGLDKIDNLKIVCQDAVNFITHYPLPIIHYDLILVDLYLGDLVLQQSSSVNFLKKLKQLLTLDGVIIINCLFYGKHRLETEKVIKQVNKVFPKINLIRAWSNLLVVCQN